MPSGRSLIAEIDRVCILALALILETSIIGLFSFMAIATSNFFPELHTKKENNKPYEIKRSNSHGKDHGLYNTYQTFSP